jgi:hypothetical protein
MRGLTGGRTDSVGAATSRYAGAHVEDSRLDVTARWSINRCRELARRAVVRRDATYVAAARSFTDTNAARSTWQLRCERGTCLRQSVLMVQHSCVEGNRVRPNQTVQSGKLRDFCNWCMERGASAHRHVSDQGGRLRATSPAWERPRENRTGQGVSARFCDASALTHGFLNLDWLAVVLHRCVRNSDMAYADERFIGSIECRGSL